MHLGPMQRFGETTTHSFIEEIRFVIYEDRECTVAPVRAVRGTGLIESAVPSCEVSGAGEFSRGAP